MLTEQQPITGHQSTPAMRILGLPLLVDAPGTLIRKIWCPKQDIIRPPTARNLSAGYLAGKCLFCGIGASSCGTQCVMKFSMNGVPSARRPFPAAPPQAAHLAVTATYPGYVLPSSAGVTVGGSGTYRRFLVTNPPDDLPVPHVRSDIDILMLKGSSSTDESRLLLRGKPVTKPCP